MSVQGGRAVASAGDRGLSRTVGSWAARVRRSGNRASQARDRGQANQRHQRQPFAGSAVGRNRAQADGAECRRPEGLQRLQGRQQRLRVLQDRASLSRRRASCAASRPGWQSQSCRCAETAARTSARTSAHRSTGRSASLVNLMRNWLFGSGSGGTSARAITATEGRAASTVSGSLILRPSSARPPRSACRPPAVREPSHRRAAPDAAPTCRPAAALDCFPAPPA